MTPTNTDALAGELTNAIYRLMHERQHGEAGMCQECSSYTIDVDCTVCRTDLADTLRSQVIVIDSLTDDDILDCVSGWDDQCYFGGVKDTQQQQEEEGGAAFRAALRRIAEEQK